MNKKPKIVETFALRANLSHFIGEVHFNGGEIIITKKGKPMAKLSQLTEKELKQIGGAHE